MLKSTEMTKVEQAFAITIGIWLLIGFFALARYLIITNFGEDVFRIIITSIFIFAASYFIVLVLLYAKE